VEGPLDDDCARQVLACTDGALPTSVFLASIATLGHRVELRRDVAGLVPFGCAEEGSY
jgi:hypothetical protein